MNKTLPLAFLLIVVATAANAQTCPDVRTAADRHGAALQLAKCLGDPNPKVRDTLAFEALSEVMRQGKLETPTLRTLKSLLLVQVRQPGGSTILQSFSTLTLSEVARTDRLKAWMTDSEREELVGAAADFLSGITDYRAFTDKDGYVHAVAHGADLAMQLGLNSEVTRPQLDRLLNALASQVIPKNPAVAYWAGEPERLARAVIVIAQRNQHSDLDWRLWFERVTATQPHAQWLNAFRSEAGIRQRHNMRAFLLSVLASAASSENPAVRQLAAPARDGLSKVE